MITLTSCQLKDALGEMDKKRDEEQAGRTKRTTIKRTRAKTSPSGDHNTTASRQSHQNASDHHEEGKSHENNPTSHND
jgi:hypothetical protein